MGLRLLQSRFDRSAFLAWEAEQPIKHEFLAGEVFAIVGARQDHVVVALALAARLREHLRGTRCRAYTSDMKLEVLAADAVFYPDAMVSCDEDDRQRPLSVQSPCLVVEVLSESTAAFDLGAKFAAYRQVPALQEYLVVDIDRRRLELFRREPAGWVLHEATGEPRQLWLASVGLGLLDADAFGDLDTAAPEPGEQGARVVQRGETLAVERNHALIAKLLPAELTMTATQALAGLPLPMLTAAQAAAWLNDSQEGFDQALHNPWA